MFLFFLFYPKSLKFRKKSEPCEPLYRRYLVYNVLNLQRHVPAFRHTALKLFFFFNQQLVFKRSAQIRRHTVLHAENRFIYICQLSPAFFVFEFFYSQKGLGLGLETHSRSAGSRLIGSSLVILANIASYLGQISSHFGSVKICACLQKLAWNVLCITV